jgi:hypothetical protein
VRFLQMMTDSIHHLTFTMAVDSHYTVQSGKPLYHFRLEMNNGSNWFGFGLAAPMDNDGMTNADLWVVSQVDDDWLIDDRNGLQGQSFPNLDMYQQVSLILKLHEEQSMNGMQK